MNKILSFLLFSVFAFSANATMEIRHFSNEDVDSIYTEFEFEDFASLFYASETPHLKVLFTEKQQIEKWRIIFDGDTTALYSTSPIIIDSLERGDHTLTLWNEADECEPTSHVSKSFKIKPRPPLVKNDAVVIGILLLVLVFEELYLLFEVFHLNETVLSSQAYMTQNVYLKHT